MYIRWVFMYGNVMCGNRENKMRYKKSNVWVKLKKERQRKAWMAWQILSLKSKNSTFYYIYH